MRLRAYWELPLDREVYAELGELLHEVLSLAVAVRVEVCDAEGVVLRVSLPRRGVPLLAVTPRRFRRHVEEVARGFRRVRVEWG